MKGLEAFEEIKIVMNKLFGGVERSEKALNTIEKELKDKAKFDAFMKRYNIDSVEELDTFFNEHLNNDIDKCSKCKELKALETIKEYGLIRYVKEWDCIGTKGYAHDLPQDVVDLLKEVLWLKI